MGQRQRARELVLTCLYAYESSGQAAEDVLQPILDRYSLDEESHAFAVTLFNKIIANIATLDDTIRRFAQNWELDRVALMDRNIMRMAICEFNFFPDIPAKVSIDQALELAKRFSTEESSRFVNGILDAVYKHSVGAS